MSQLHILLLDIRIFSSFLLGIPISIGLIYLVLARWL